MSENPFASPAASSGLDWEAANGRLLVIEPLSVEKDVPTMHGDADAVRANVYVIDGPDPQDYTDVLVFPRRLQGQIRSQLGKKVIGRLGQGAKQPGKNPPWLIQDATEADIELGKKWLASRDKATFAQPAQAAGGGEPPF